MNAENSTMLIATCQQPSCNVNGDGKCVENHEQLAECPFYVPLPVSVSHDEVDATKKRINSLLLPYGRDLRGGPVNGTAAEAILKESLTRLVVVGGSPASGKTTLVASLYEQFQQGAFANYMFRSSQTLVGFEHRCHLSRMSAERPQSDTPRTVPEDTLRFLHLEILKQVTNSTPVSLLFTDISGERFEALQKHANEATTVATFSRADHFVLLLDSEKLLDLNRRQQEKSKAMMLLRRLREASVLGKENYVHILFSKWDTVLRECDKGRQDECVKFKEIVQNEFQQMFADHFGRLEFAEVAARPDEGKPIGLDTLLTNWVETTPYQERQWHAPVELPVNLLDCWQFFAKESAK